jgi:hypothetical protein
MDVVTHPGEPSNLFRVGWLFLVLLPAVALGQKPIRGRITDSTNGEPLQHATVYHAASGRGTTSSLDGFFQLFLAQPGDTLFFRYVGYETTVQVLSSDDFLRLLEIRLRPGTLMSEEIEVTATHDLRKDPGMSTYRIAPAQLEALPTFLGQRDILKSLHYLPGIQSGNEGTSGVYVRGGSSDQTLILLDGVPLYQAFHSAGFVSVFSSAILHSGSLYSGAFPARFGGRLSGILDLQLREGNKNKISGDVEAGVVSSELHLELPLKKINGAFLISGRKSNLVNSTQWIGLTNPALLPSTDFGDLLIKGSFSIKPQTKLSLTGFLSSDFLADEYKSSWVQTQTNPITYNEKSSYRVGWVNRFVNATVTTTFANGWYARFRSYAVSFRNESNEVLDVKKTQLGVTTPLYYTDASNSTGLSSFAGGLDVSKNVNENWLLEAGGVITNSRFITGNRSFYVSEEDSIDQQTNLSPSGPVSSLDSDVYISATQKKERFEAVYGFRFSTVSASGKTYFIPQPRFSMRYVVTEKVTAKASASVMMQGVHAAASANPGLTTEYWVPSSNGLRPQHGWIVAAGVVWVPSKNWDFSTEYYYRGMANVVEFKQGASFFLPDKTWYDQITQGTGQAHGIEFLIKKNSGKLRGSIAYTWSRSQRIFDDLNFGQPFLYKFDRTHNFSATSTYQVRKSVILSATYTLFSGYLLTLPDQLFYYSLRTPTQSRSASNETRYYPVRNNYRMPLYHRLDIAAVKNVQFRHVNARLRAGLYNAYSRENPVYALPGVRDGVPGMQMFNLFPVVPFVALGGSF